MKQDEGKGIKLHKTNTKKPRVVVIREKDFLVPVLIYIIRINKNYIHVYIYKEV